LLYRTQLFFQKSYFFKGRLIFVIFSGEDCDKNKYLYTQISVLKHFVYIIRKTKNSSFKNEKSKKEVDVAITVSNKDIV